ncbi:AAA family ATPase [candidate division KSB1 bacterium]|nr:AAA family ATPase [candidate division KSB1 bacterium]
MYISHITLKNWRNFRSLNVELSNRVFLVGPNASGKSNFIDVFKFLHDLAKFEGGGLQQAINMRENFSKIRCLAARQSPNVEISVVINEGIQSDSYWQYELGLKQESRGSRLPLLAYERVQRNGEQILNRPDPADLKDKLRLTQTHLEQINMNEKFRIITHFFESIRYFHLIPQLIRNPEAFHGPGIPEDPFGKNFLERVARTPEKTRRARLKKIETALKIAVPHFEALSDIKDEFGIPHLEAIYGHWRARGAKQRETQFSDGTLRIISLFWSLLEGDALLLLEEPELSLHAGIVQKLPGLMYHIQRQNKNQMIVSTHSADLLSDPGIGGHEVLLFQPGSEGTQVTPADSKAEIKALLEGGLSIAEAALPYTLPENIQNLELK